MSPISMTASGWIRPLLVLLAATAFGPPLMGQDAIDEVILQQKLATLIRRKSEIKGQIAEAAVSDIGVARQMFDDRLYGSRGQTATAVRSWLDSLLREKIASLDQAAPLTDAQRQKLQLAGRGDIKGFFDRVEEQRRKYLLIKDDEIDKNMIREMSLETRRLRDMLDSGLFEERSLFAKVRMTTLTPAQSGRADILRKIELAGGRIERQPRDSDIEAVLLSETEFADRDLRHIGELAGLRRLALDFTQVTDAGLAHLQGLTSLELLDLSETKITDAGLRHTSRMASLKVIHLAGTQVSDTGLTGLKFLKHVTMLDLSRTQITDAGLEHLKGLTQLEGLDLTGLPMTDAGIDHLLALSSLRRLFLDETKITDTGLLRLSELTKLERLDLFGTKVTDAAVTRLERSLPKLKIFR